MSEAATAVILPGQKRAGAWTFGILFLFESLARAFAAGVLSIQAYDLLGSSQKVSMLGAVVSGTVLVITLFMPFLFGKMRRRWAYTIGCLLLVAGSGALATFSLVGQITGTVLRNAGASITNVTLQLYILDHIKKSDLTTSEPLRLALSTIAWGIGPYSGVWLYQNYGPLAPQLFAMFFALVLLGIFWFLRLHDPELLPKGTLQPFNPIANVARFVAQPRLRLAWVIAFTRSSFWAAFFTYGPLLMIEGGLGKSAGGAIISISQLLLLTTVFFGQAAKRKGVRLVITLCFVVMSLGAVVAGLVGIASPWVAAGLLLCGAAGAAGLDGIGAIPYMRAVKFHERQRMTAVYRTFIDFSDLLPSLIYAVVLRYAGVSIVFVLMGVFASIIGVLSWRHLPKGM